MLKTAFSVLFVLTISIGVGGASVWYALDSAEGLTALRVGGWTAYPDLGSANADPYSKAGIARDAVLPLGTAEGLSFHARTDMTGSPLRRNCSYMLTGSAPVSRFWTLHSSQRETGQRPLSGSLFALHSLEILRREDNSFVVTVGPRPAPGNWLATAGAGPMTLVLTLYDAPAVSGPSMSDLELPQIARVRCDG